MGKMIKFNLGSTFIMVPEGNRKLTITEITARPSGNPDHVEITWTDKESKGTIKENISFEKMLWKLSRLCQLAFGAEDGQEMEITQICNGLAGKTFDVEVVHTQGTRAREDGTFPTFANARKINGIVNEDISSQIPANMVSTPRASILDDEEDDL